MSIAVAVRKGNTIAVAAELRDLPGRRIEELRTAPGDHQVGAETGEGKRRLLAVVIDHHAVTAVERAR